jgi:ABC-type antimicrobial peptide transport system permease subunit
MQELIRPIMTIEQFIIYPVWLFIFTLIAGLYPARHAAKMSPAAAMRRSF